MPAQVNSLDPLKEVPVFAKAPILQLRINSAQLSAIKLQDRYGSPKSQLLKRLVALVAFASHYPLLHLIHVDAVYDVVGLGCHEDWSELSTLLIYRRAVHDAMVVERKFRLRLKVTAPSTIRASNRIPN